MKKKLNCIMLIDDNEDDNFFHEIILKDMGIADHIQIAESGFEGLEYLNTESMVPQLIFLDINMPKMNGWEFLEQYTKLKEKQKAKAIIIMLTTSLNPEDKKRAEKIQEITSFETKPVTADMIKKF